MSKDKVKNSTTRLLVDDINEEKKAAESIFRSSLVAFLSVEDEVNLDIVDDYNKILMALLLEESNFKNDLENALYHNKEKLTDKDFTIEKTKQESTVANWLRDFIKIRGTGKFSNLDITKYVTNSANCRRLDEKEKNLLRNLLSVYRSVKFFPESLQNVPEKERQIIPIKKKEEKAISGTKLRAPKTESERNIEKLKKQEEELPENSLERMALDEEVEKQKRLEDLEYQASQFAEGSLERMALDEEISHLKKQ